MADNVPVTAGVGTPIAADDIASVWHQRVKRSVGPDGSATDFLDKSSRSDTFTGAGNGTTVDVSAQGMSQFSIQVKGTGGAPSAWAVVLEISLNNVNFFEVMRHSSAADPVQVDGEVVPCGANRFPTLYFRSRCVSVTLGGATNIVVTIVGKP